MLYNYRDRLQILFLLLSEFKWINQLQFHDLFPDSS